MEYFKELNLPTGLGEKERICNYIYMPTEKQLKNLTHRFPQIDLKTRFWAKVKKGDGCWEWQAQNVNGYGRIRINGKLVLSHRVVWEMNNGKIPNGIDILHSCDNPSCVNPKHLWAGTHQENMKDRDNKNRNGNRYRRKI